MRIRITIEIDTTESRLAVNEAAKAACAPFANMGADVVYLATEIPPLNRVVLSEDEQASPFMLADLLEDI